MPRTLQPPKISFPRKFDRVRVLRSMQTWGVRLAPLFWYGIGVVAVITVVLTIGIWLRFGSFQPSYIPELDRGVKIYDRHDKLAVTVYGEKDQEPVPLKQISQHLPKAVVAAEDHEFYKHDGIDVLGIMRATLANVGAMDFVQGGSTISQQLIKNLYFEGDKRDLLIKLQEALMAIDMETRYSKEKIMESYLNTIYFGRGVYGAQRAAQTFFGKDASKLTVAESAYLAALITAPSELSKPAKQKQAVTRQRYILDQMAELKLISPKQAEAAKKQQLKFRSTPARHQRFDHYTGEVLRVVKEKFGGDRIFNDQLKIYTNMDQYAQEAAQRSLTAGIMRAPRGINQGALVSINVHDGAVTALVGAAGSFKKNQWSRALSPHTAGSAMKPFVYLAGLLSGDLHTDTMIEDAPLTIPVAGSKPYEPRNFDRQYMGLLTIRKALALSRNTCAVRVANEVGPEYIANVAKLAGIRTSQLDPNLSLALGSSAVSPLEMAAAYATLARGGEYVEPVMIRRVETADGMVLMESRQNRHRVFHRDPVAQLVDALQDVVEHGTGTRAQLFDRPVAGKTGTSDNAKDIWFIGFTPDMVTAVWGGNDENKSVAGSQVTGGTVMAAIWQRYMSAYYKHYQLPAGKFDPPENPLMGEPEPIYVLPSPSTVFEQLFGSPQVVREYRWSEQDGGDRPKKRGLVKKILRWLDFTD